MALLFGWHAGESRASHWPDDPAFTEIPSDVLKAWSEDCDASHLVPYIKPGETPTTINLRPLTHREVMRGRALMARIDNDPMVSMYDVGLYMFRVGVSIEGLPSTVRDSAGADHPVHITEQGIRMLSDAFVASLDRAYPGIVEHYGLFLMRTNMLSAVEKKASSPPSTEKPSLAKVEDGATGSPG